MHNKNTNESRINENQSNVSFISFRRNALACLAGDCIGGNCGNNCRSRFVLRSATHRTGEDKQHVQFVSTGTNGRCPRLIPLSRTTPSQEENAFYVRTIIIILFIRADWKCSTVFFCSSAVEYIANIYIYIFKIGKHEK